MGHIALAAYKCRRRRCYAQVRESKKAHPDSGRAGERLVLVANRWRIMACKSRVKLIFSMQL